MLHPGTPLISKLQQTQIKVSVTTKRQVCSDKKISWPISDTMQAILQYSGGNTPHTMNIANPDSWSSGRHSR